MAAITQKGERCSHRISPEKVREMRVLRRQGMNKTYIAQKVEVSEDSVRRYTCDIAPAVRGKALSAKDVTGLLMSWN